MTPLFYMLLITAIALLFVIRLLMLRKERKGADEKIRFFINLAHDIRTPLTLIKTPLEVINGQEPLTPDGRKNLQTALKNINSLLQLSANLMSLERITTHAEKLHIAEHELNECLQEQCALFQTYAELKGIQLECKGTTSPLYVWMDKEKISSIMKNLLSNALKYTPRGGRVSVCTTEERESWSIEVSDTGIGIPADEQKQLFKRHRRGSNAINAQVTGNGIGLVLVKQLVLLHKGTLSLNSIEGVGSHISISFKKSKKRYKHAMFGKSSPDKPVQPLHINPKSAIPREVPAETDKHHPKLLIAEDNVELQDFLSRTLSPDYLVSTCDNGRQAIDAAKKQLPDLIISDVMMPEVKGDELCRTLKRDIETSHIPIILLTALGSERHIIEGWQVGADEYIVKPFNIDILRATIAGLLANRALLRRKYANLELNEDVPENCVAGRHEDLDLKFITTVKQKVEEHIDNPDFNVDHLCNLLNMSRTSFYNKIKALTGEAPADYIRVIRLKRASQLLREQHYSITEVAERTGFSDAKYFRTVFKKHYGVSPREYSKG